MRIADVFVGVHADAGAFRREMAELTAGVSKTAGKIGTTLTAIGTSMTKVGRGLSTNLTLPILAVGAATGKMALDFSNALTKVVALTDVTQDEISGISDGILELAQRIGKSPVELAEGFYFLASAGFDAAESMDVLTIAAEASAAGLGETQDVARTIGAVVNAYGKENLSAARATDILVAAIGQGTAEAPEFAASIGQVVGSAAQIGATFADVSAALASLTLTGLDASEAAVSLNQVFVTLFKPTEEGAEALANYGMSAAGLRAEIKEKGLLPVLQELATAFDGDAEATAAVFGNVRALRGILALTGPAASKTAVVFQKVANSTGSLNEAVETYLASPGAKLNISLAKLQVSAIRIGEDVLPVVADVLAQVADNAAALAEWWEKLDDGTREFIVRGLALAATLGPVVLVVGKLTSGLGMLFTALSKVTGTKGLATIGAGAKLGLLGVAVSALALGLNEAGDAARGFFTELVHGKEGAKTLGELQELAENEKFGSMLLDWEVSTEEFVQVLEAAGGDAERAFHAIEDAAGDVDVALASLVDRSAGMTESWANAWANSGLLIESRWGTTLQVIGGHARRLDGDIAAHIRNGKFVIEEAAEKAIVDPIDKKLQQAINDAATAASDLINALEQGLADGPKDLQDELRELRKALQSPYKLPARKKDILDALGLPLIRNLLNSEDPKLQARGALLVSHLLEEYELIAPGVLESGKGINPALKKGMQQNFPALLTYLKTQIRVPITDQFQLADILEGMGYAALAAYVRGLERARRDRLAGKMAAIAGQVLRETKVNKRDFFLAGWGAGSSFIDGVNAGIDSGIPELNLKTDQILARLNYSGSPPYTYSRLAGEGVGKSYLAGLVEALKKLPSMMSLLTPLSPMLPAVALPAGYQAPSAAPQGGDTIHVHLPYRERHVSAHSIARDLKRLDEMGQLRVRRDRPND